MITCPLLKLILFCSSQKWCMSRKNLASSLKLIPGAKLLCFIFLALAIIGKGPREAVEPFSTPTSPELPHPLRASWQCMLPFCSGWQVTLRMCTPVIGLALCQAFPSNWVFIYCKSPVCWSIEAGLLIPWEQPPAALPEGGPSWMLANERVSEWIAC